MVNDPSNHAFSMRPTSRRVLFAMAFAFLLATPLLSTPPPKGVRVYSIGHSFHMFVPAILKDIATSAGITDHVQVGASAIGGSYVHQHWEKTGDNTARVMIENEKPDVVTIAPIYLPDDGIEAFTRLIAEKSPHTRILLQEFWLPYDARDIDYLKKRRARTPPPTPDRDALTIAYLRSEHRPYFDNIDEHVRQLNHKYSAPIISVTPVGQAILALREKVIAGEAPGVSRQSELFRDPIGHPNAHIKVLTAYCHFVMIYRQNPQGLPTPAALREAGDPEAVARLNRLLQELAWNAVTAHPLSGVTAAVSENRR